MFRQPPHKLSPPNIATHLRHIDSTSFVTLSHPKQTLLPSGQTISTLTTVTIPRQKANWLTAASRPADLDENLPDPEGGRYYFNEAPNLSNAGKTDLIRHKRLLYKQKPNFYAGTHPGQSSRNLFRLDQAILNYPAEVIARHPDWIASPNLTSNDETI